MRLLTCLILFMALCGCSGERTPESVETPATGGALEGLEEQWVVINYWAKWCKPCAEEIPELNRLHATYPKVTVLGVNYDAVVGEELAMQVSDLGIEFDILPQDPAASLGTPRPVVLPTTLVLAPGGTLAATLIGPQTFEGLARVTTQIPPVE